MSFMYRIVAVCHRSIVPPRSFDFYLRLQSYRSVSSWPELPDDISIIKVKENQPPGTMVKQFSTSKSEYNAILYSLRQPRDYFVIDSTTGDLVTFVSLDREDMLYDEFPIEIIAIWAGDPSKSIVLPIQVIVEDDNDNCPVIISPINSTIVVLVPDFRNESIARVVAVDVDKGLNGQFFYSIDDSDLFTIDTRAGTIWLTRIPMLQNYDLNVSVTDCGQPPLTGWMVLTFNFQRSEIENKIRFSTKTISMNLSITNDQRMSILGRVTLASTASYSNPAVRFHLMAGNYDHLFEIDKVKGDIKPSRQILISDIGITEILKLSVVVYLISDTSNYDITKLLIHINHGNNYAPSFAKSKYFVKLPEGEAITDFLTVAANDPDLGVFGMITYRLLGDVDDRRISIDSSTGRLSCSSLLYSDRKTYNFQVVATDSLGGPFSKNKSAFVQIDVKNSMQTPMEFNSTHFVLNVKENLPRGTIVGRITVNSKPEHVNIVYHLNPGHSLIDISSSDGQLATNGPIDRESIPFIEVTIYATSISVESQIFQSTKATVTIKITDVNDNAPVPSQNPFIVYISNPDALTSPLATLSATDLDSASNITFQFDLDDLPTRSLSPQYHLNPLSGLLKYRFNSLKSDFGHHLLRVIVSDNGNPPQTTKVIVVIAIQRRSGLLHIAPDKATFQLLENPSVGAFIGQIYIDGNCRSGNASYTIIDGINKELVFMHALTGKLFVSNTNTIDREQTKRIVLWTQAHCFETDFLGFKTVIIKIHDVDDNKPIFSQKQYEAFISEGQPPKTPVIRTLVYDPDEADNSQVEYFIEMSPDEFSIDSEGTIRTNIPLNFHTKSMYNLIIKANSKSTPLLFAECRVTVHIININDQRPLFSSPVQNINIPEDKPVGSLIATITATDSDGPDRISYRIRPRAMMNSTRFLSVAFDSGEVFLSRKLKTSDVGRHEVDIVADDGKYSSSTILSISVTDINGDIPILVEDGYQYLVSETWHTGSIIGYMHALDSDQGLNGEVSFEISPRVPWIKLTDFQNNTAAIYLVSQPKFIRKVYFIGIQLTDKAEDPKHRLSSVSSISLITDTTNSHPPQFLNGSQTILNIDESTTIGTKVAFLYCKDPEDHVTYMINSSNPSIPIHIESVSGDIFLTRSLLNKPYLTFEETVMCMDNGKPQRTTTLLLILKIVRNVQPPRLLICYIENITLELFETSQFPLFIKDLKTSGTCPCENGVFSLASAVPSKAMSNSKLVASFHVDKTGKLWLNKTTESETWKLVLRVINKDSIGKFTSDLYYNLYLRTTITVTKAVDPRSDSCVNIDKLSSVIKENETPSMTVVSLPMWYSYMRYTMVDDDNFMLSCNGYPTSLCRILSRTSLDYERNERFDLTLEVSGMTSNRRSCSHTLLISVNVLDVDEYSPIFSQSEYSYSVPGGVPELGRVVFTVSATDNDRGRFGLVYYRLESNHNGHFAIRNNTGEIYIMTAFPAANDSRSRRKRSLDDKEQTGYHRKTFLINAIASSGERSSTANIRLKLLVPDENSNRIILTTMQIHLIIGLLCTVVFIVIIIAFVLLLRRAHCFHNRRGERHQVSVNDSDGYQSNLCRNCDKRVEHESPCDPDLIMDTKDPNVIDGHHLNTQFIDNDPWSQSFPSKEPSSSQLYHHNRPVQYYNGDNYNNNQIHLYKVNRNDTRSHDSDHSGTSSSCYSSINQRGLRNQYPPPVTQFSSIDNNQRYIDRNSDYTKRSQHRPAFNKKRITRSSVQLKPTLPYLDSMELGIINNNAQRSYTNVNNYTDSSLNPLIYGSGSDGQRIQVLSVDVPQPGAMSYHSQSSSNRHDTSNAQTYSDITSIDS